MTMTAPQAREQEVEWRRWPEAEALVGEHLAGFLAAHAPARALVAETEERASTRLFDLLDHLVLCGDASLPARLASAGYERQAVVAPAGLDVFAHPGAQLPRLVLTLDGSSPAWCTTIAVKVESIDDFLMVRGLSAPIEGSPLSPYRAATLWPEVSDTGVTRQVLVVERRGHTGLLPLVRPADWPAAYLAARERWATRPRHGTNDLAVMAATLDLAQGLAVEVGRDTAAWIAFEVERSYWEARNGAAQAQKARQDRVGIGWANHDHHTFRSSRAAFPTLIAVLEALGFVCRERFYAGAEAGWGAQVLEQTACGLVVFADVDLHAEETEIDFAHTVLPDHGPAGTVGLWCALHGESILGAGMHHLEAQFDFERLRDDLAAVGIGMMAPFSNYPHLRQAFTKGERWSVAEGRLARLYAAGVITATQHDTFAAEGAIGSHLENLQRRDGYKGFNQRNVSTIIRQTDPRLQ